jgi:hypothetical protein
LQAIVQSGIPILLRKDIPDHLIPSDSRVEIDAKIAAGKFNFLSIQSNQPHLAIPGRIFSTFNAK